MKASLHTWMTIMTRKASGRVTSMHKPLYYNDCSTVCTHLNQC